MPYQYPGNSQGGPGEPQKRNKKDKKMKGAKKKGKHKEAFNPALYGNSPWFNPHYPFSGGPFPGQFGQPDFTGNFPQQQQTFNPGAFGGRASSPPPPPHPNTLESNTNANAIANDGHQRPATG